MVDHTRINIDQPVAAKAIGLTQRELMMEMRDEQRKMQRDLTYLRGQMDVLSSQKHDSRIEDLEKWRHRADGRMDLLSKGVPFISGLVGIASAFVVFIGFALVGS